MIKILYKKYYTNITLIPFLFGLFFQLFFLNCNNHPFEYKSFNPDTNILGKTWAHQILEIIDNHPFHFDSTYSWLFHECIKDTMFNEKHWYHIKETVFKRDLFDMDTLYSEYAVSIGTDSLFVFIYDNNDPYFPIFRNKKQAKNYKVNIIRSYRYCSMVLPLFNNISTSWYLNKYDTSSNAFNVKKIYVGQEEIHVIGGSFYTWKIKWDWSEISWIPHDISRCDWVSESGIILSVADWGSFFFMNEWGDSVGKCDFYKENIEYLGKNTDGISLTPYYNSNFRDSLAVVILASWSFDKYSEWLKAHIDSNMIFSISSFSTYDLDSIQIADLVASIWNKGFSDVKELIQILDSAEFPNSIYNIYSLNDFVKLAIENEQYVQGWDDCDLIWQTNGTSAPHPYPFGRSKKRDELLTLLYQH